jgi:hypothetical protein
MVVEREQSAACRRSLRPAFCPKRRPAL